MRKFLQQHLGFAGIVGKALTRQAVKQGEWAAQKGHAIDHPTCIAAALCQRSDGKASGTVRENDPLSDRWRKTTAGGNDP